MRLLTCVALLGILAPVSAQEPSVSFHKDIRPIFQANCQGCHQPARSLGEYVMTDFVRMLKGGESEESAIVPGQPDESYLVSQITPDPN